MDTVCATNELCTMPPPPPEKTALSVDRKVDRNPWKTLRLRPPPPSSAGHVYTFRPMNRLSCT
jgi:hypothetical protein